MKSEKESAVKWNLGNELWEWTIGIIIGFLLGPVLFHFLTFLHEPMTKWLEFAIAAGFYRIVIRRKNFYLPKQAKEWIEVIVFAGFLAFNIRVFVIQAYKIPSGSMIPTFQVKDHLFVSKFNYWSKLPKRGDIVVFKFPEDPKKDFVKRVIGVEGDTVQIVNKQVFVSGNKMDEPYKIHDDPILIPGEPRDNLRLIMVPKGCFFAMGDNRDKSYDSRFWGFVPGENLKGKALVIYWPLNRIRLVR